MPKRKSDVQVCLEILQRLNGAWLERPYRTAPIMWHSRVSELRSRGHQIEMRRVDVPGERADYQYRLVQQERKSA